ncbi:DUF5806 family protein [Haloferax profundi]|uniref:Uncharacterized protein n=1 Tax=Haloferax profundi TaxID=1544718 RepID=A0A0W1SWC4_9EURY|nr:DUF5806 family protein [Haloferax profundi]KTG30602.1 hypothetical protein AUR66_06965 [Haloferax profundi]
MTDEFGEADQGSADAEMGSDPTEPVEDDDPSASSSADTAGADAESEAGVEMEDAAETESGADTGAASDADVSDRPDADASDEDENDAADADTESATDTDAESDTEPEADVPEDVQKYARFKKVDGAQYDRVNDFLRERTYVTAREWAIARLCADFRTETGVEMTKIGENLPELVPFMTDTYSPQAVNQARSAFRDKVRKSGATFLYGAMSGFFTAEELDEMMYEVTEIAKFLLEVEGVDLSVEEELEAEERISSVMREVREASTELRSEELSNDD